MFSLIHHVWHDFWETFCSVFIFFIISCVLKFLGVGHCAPIQSPKAGNRADQITVCVLLCHILWIQVCVLDRKAEGNRGTHHGEDKTYTYIYTKSEGLFGGVYVIFVRYNARNERSTFKFMFTNSIRNTQYTHGSSRLHSESIIRPYYTYSTYIKEKENYVFNDYFIQNHRLNCFSKRGGLLNCLFIHRGKWEEWIDPTKYGAGPASFHVARFHCFHRKGMKPLCPQYL